ncbi:MAG: hypothetical protein IIA92_04490 [Chloroflexi bacterium]|nr:hypothetical protein [Chloroflexota bacterium]
MTTLNIYLFGNVQINHNGLSSPLRLSHGLKALFGYLVLHRNRSLSREVLAGLFWGESGEAKARSCLSTAIWRLRSLLEPDGVARGTYLVTIYPEEISFNRESDYWLDVEAFESAFNVSTVALDESQPYSRINEIETAIRLYGSDLMEGFYDDWVLVQRERFRSYYLTGLLRLMRYSEEQGALEQGISYAKKILEVEPLREDVHRDLMRLYLADGRRALARRQYKVCENLLESELGVPPMEETQSLYGFLATGGDSLTAGSADSGKTRPLHQTVHKLETAMRKLDEAKSQLKQAVRALEGRNQDPST